VKPSRLPSNCGFGEWEAARRRRCRQREAVTGLVYQHWPAAGERLLWVYALFGLSRRAKQDGPGIEPRHFRWVSRRAVRVNEAVGNRLAATGNKAAGSRRRRSCYLDGPTWRWDSGQITMAQAGLDSSHFAYQIKINDQRRTIGEGNREEMRV
jgi:hypothetical protein